MPRNGSGVYALAEPAFVTQTPISSAGVNSDFSDIADALTASLARDSQGGMTAVLQLHADGFVYLVDPNTGMHRTAADTQAIEAGGTDVVIVTSSGITVTGFFRPTASDGGALGSGTLMWSDLFLALGGVISFNNGDVTITHSTDLLAFAGAASGYTFDTAVTISTGGLNVAAGAVTVPAGSIAVAALNTGLFATQAAQETATSNVVAVTPGTQKFSPLSPKAWAYVTNNGTATLVTGSGVASVVRNSAGVVSVTWTTQFSSANYGVFATGAAAVVQSCDAIILGVSSAQVLTFTSGGPSDQPFWVMAMGDV